MAALSESLSRATCSSTQFSAPRGSLTWLLHVWGAAGLGGGAGVLRARGFDSFTRVLGGPLAAPCGSLPTDSHERAPISIPSNSIRGDPLPLSQPGQC